MSSTLLHLDSDSLYYSTLRLSNPHHVDIPKGVTTVIGPNGAGKSLLANILERGRNFRTNRIITPCDTDLRITKIQFSDIHSLRGITASGYYQQRYEATMNDDVPTVSQLLDINRHDKTQFEMNCRLMSLSCIEDRRINSLSSGELRKLLIATALSSSPDLLILDNPYIGLDSESRQLLDNALSRLPEAGINVMLLVCDPSDIPSFTTAILPITDMTIHPLEVPMDNIESVRMGFYKLFDYAIDTSLLQRPLDIDNHPVDYIVKLDKCNVSYGNRVILNNVSWSIHDNERWALTGPNGSGKSTLLSLINADNPAAYRSGLILFDRRRGTGESIWDIKRRIGYVSPEMKLYFTANGTVIDVIGHGLVDTVGNYVKLTPTQTAMARQWVEMLHMQHIAEQRFSTLSSGQQQQVLLARALIKQPRLLILDEPMHGLDYGRKRAMRALVNYMAARADKPESPYPMALIYVTHRPDEMPECINHSMSLQNRTISCD